MLRLRKPEETQSVWSEVPTRQGDLGPPSVSCKAVRHVPRPLGDFGCAEDRFFINHGTRKPCLEKTTILGFGARFRRMNRNCRFGNDCSFPARMRGVTENGV